MSRPLLVIALACALLCTNCSDQGGPLVSDGETGPDPVSYAAELQPIFDASCIGCHGGTAPQAGLSLESTVSHANLVGVESGGYPSQDLVVAGNADASVLQRKLDGDAGFGGIMPPTGSLPTAQIESIRTWIDEGALDN